MFNPEQYNCKISWLNFLITTFFYIGYATSSLIIYNLYWNSTCSIPNIISIQKWLLGSGITYSILPLFHGNVVLYHRKPFAIIYYSYLYFLLLPFNIGYSILGTIILFHDSMTCLETTSSLWIEVLFSVIYQWSIIPICIYEVYQKYKREYKK